MSVEVADAFNRIKGTGREHWDLASLPNPAAVARDARAMFRDAVTIVRSVIGSDVQNGKLVFTPPMTRYLDRQGKVVRPVPPSEPPATKREE